jgi:hypothetical protein
MLTRLLLSGSVRSGGGERADERHERCPRPSGSPDRCRPRRARGVNAVAEGRLRQPRRIVGEPSPRSIAAEVISARSWSWLGADRFTSQMSTQYGFAQERSAIVPEAFGGVDGQGRAHRGHPAGCGDDDEGSCRAQVSRTGAVDAGGASYLAVMMKTLVADIVARRGHLSSTGRGYTHYVRVVGGSACSRCAILAGKASGRKLSSVTCPVSAPRRRSLRCERRADCTTARGRTSIRCRPKKNRTACSRRRALRPSARARTSRRWSTRVAVRKASATRGMRSGRRLAGDPRGVFVKTTIGYRPNGDPVRVYTTSEGTTARGQFGKRAAADLRFRRAAVPATRAPRGCGSCPSRSCRSPATTSNCGRRSSGTPATSTTSHRSATARLGLDRGDRGAEARRPDPGRPCDGEVRQLLPRLALGQTEHPARRDVGWVIPERFRRTP